MIFDWVAKGETGFLPSLMKEPIGLPDIDFQKIARITADTAARGALPLWEGYEAVYKKGLGGDSFQRTAEQVATAADIGSTLGL